MLTPRLTPTLRTLTALTLTLITSFAAPARADTLEPTSAVNSASHGGSTASASTQAAHAIEAHVLDTPDGRLYYETEGQGEALILVAGGPGASRISFQPWFSRLAAQHQLVYFDAIGRGRSDRLKDPHGYTVARDVEDIERLRVALGANKVSVLGQSYGGIPALAYALRYPSRVSHLILSSAMTGAASFQANIDSANHTLRTHFPDAWARVQALRAQGILSGDERIGKEYAVLPDMLYWHDARLASGIKRASVPGERLNGEVYAAMLGDDPEQVVGGTLRGYEPWPQIAALRAPTLVIGGRYDRVTTPEIALHTYQSLPASLAQLAMFDLSGHRPWVEESDAYFERVSNFLADQAPTRIAGTTKAAPTATAAGSVAPAGTPVVAPASTCTSTSTPSSSVPSAANATTPATVPANPLLGQWRLIRVDNVLPDGRHQALYGDEPAGRLNFDASGHYQLQIVQGNRQPFASPDRARATDAENRAGMAGSNAHFGHYQLEDGGHSLRFQIEHASFPNWDGSTQLRPFILRGNRLTYVVPTPTTGQGVSGEVEWERVE